MPIATGVSGLGTGVATALAVNTGSAGAVVLFNGALGTPSSGTLTNATGLPVSTGISGLGAGVATFLATPSSANLAAALTDETGTGANVFATSPTLVTPILGTPTSGTLTNCTGLPLTTGVTGDLPFANIAQVSAYSLVGNTSGSTADIAGFTIGGLTQKASPAATDLVLLQDQAASGALKYATVSSIASAGSVSSIAGNTGAFTLGYGLTNATNELRASLTSITNSLSGDVALNNTANYFDGPSVAQGTSGTWFVSGTVTVRDTAGGAGFLAKLYDGTTVIASAIINTPALNVPAIISLSGVITSPAGNLRIAVRDASSTSGRGSPSCTKPTARSRRSTEQKSVIARLWARAAP